MHGSPAGPRAAVPCPPQGGFSSQISGKREILGLAVAQHQLALPGQRIGDDPVEIHPRAPNRAEKLEAAEHKADALQEQLDRIHDQLLNAKQRAREPRNRAQRPAGYRALPRALLENFGNLLVVYGEAVRPEGEPDAETELVHWEALRVRDAARFDCVVRPRSGMPSAVRLAHLGLTREEVENGVDLAELRRRWLDFALDSDVLAAWNPRTLARFEACLGSATGGVGLKGVYRRVRGGTGDLDGVLSSEDSVMLPDALAESLGKVRGRARIRLENALRVVLLLRERAQHGAAKEKRKVLPPP